jgi:hypothetical protein
MITYKVTSLLVMAEPYKVMLKVFPDWNGQPSEYGQDFIKVTFEESQQPVDLGPMFEVKVISE